MRLNIVQTSLQIPYNEDLPRSNRDDNKVDMPSKSKSHKKFEDPELFLRNLIRICALSVLLSIGYAINFISVIRSIKNNPQTEQPWKFIYLASTLWLLIACCVMIFVSLCGFQTRKCGCTTNRRKKLFLSIFFFIGVSGYVFSIVDALLFDHIHNQQKYICWQFELLYALLPLYIIFLIYFQQLSSLNICIRTLKLIFFALILLITPFVQLFLIQLSSSSFEFNLIVSSYMSVCIATLILTPIHIAFFLAHYNSGLLLKSTMIFLFTYSFIICFTEKIDFDQYDDQYRIYYYYALLAALYVIFSCELFIAPPPKIITDYRMMDYVLKRDSFAARSYNPMDGAFVLNKQLTVNRRLTVQMENERFQGIAHQVKVSKTQNELEMKGNKTYKNPNTKIKSVIKIFCDFKPVEQNAGKYFSEIVFDDSEEEQIRLYESISVIVPFYNESASEIHATLRSLYLNFKYIKQENSMYEHTHFNVLLVCDGWFKADISTKQYLTKLYNFTEIDNTFKNININRNENKHYTVILQTKGNIPLCINPFDNGEQNFKLKVTTIIKIDNRKKANSHEWFLGEYGFGEWCKCDYMYFTDAYSTMNREGLYKMLTHMREPKNTDVVCCTGRARVYTIEQEQEFKQLLKEQRDIDKMNKYGLPKMRVTIYDENEEKYDSSINKAKWWNNEIFRDSDPTKNLNNIDKSCSDDDINYKIQDMEYDYRLSMNAHLRNCQMFEFEALYGTIGFYLLGGFLPVIPGPCGFYRSKYLLKDEVRGWYFDKINQKNDPNDMDLVLGNMKLAEDRILTVTSILNCDEPVRHSLIPECIFYFDPMPNLTQLMKQRRRWINGSIATVIFVLRKISFSQWNVNCLRRVYVLLIWYMQLFMFTILFLTPPLLFIVSFQYGLETILDALLVDHNDGEKQNTITTIVLILMLISWIIYLLFIYYVQKDDTGNTQSQCNICCFVCKKKEKICNCPGFDLIINKHDEQHVQSANKIKAFIVKLLLVFSFSFGFLTLTGAILQFLNLITHIVNADHGILFEGFNFFVMLIEVIFFVQSFILAPIFSKDIQTLKILLKTFFHYFMYSPFYVTFFFINAIANIHDLSWGTRPDKPDTNSTKANAKNKTYMVLGFLLLSNIIIAMIIQPFTEGTYGHIVFFVLLSLPSIFQIVFAVIWLIKEKLIQFLSACKPRKIQEQYDYQINQINADNVDHDYH